MQYVLGAHQRWLGKGGCAGYHLLCSLLRFCTQSSPMRDGQVESGVQTIILAAAKMLHTTFYPPWYRLGQNLTQARTSMGEKNGEKCPPFYLKSIFLHFSPLPCLQLAAIKSWWVSKVMDDPLGSDWGWQHAWQWREMGGNALCLRVVGA